MQTVRKYSDKFDSLIQLSKDYKLDNITSELKSETDKLKNEYLFLVVIGQFKRGKSTLINSLIGHNLLPTAVLPLTSIVTMIKFSEEQKINIIFEDEHNETIQENELYNFITESGNPENKKHVKLVEILYPSEFLKDGIVIIDTPGIGSLFLHNTKSTESFIPKIDAAIFVLSVDPPITQIEYQFFEEVSNYVDRFYFVMNKIDMVDEKARKEIISYTKNILSSNNQKYSFNIFPISAKLALEGKLENDNSKLEASGILPFENEIKNSIRSEKFSILQSSTRRKFDFFVSHLSFSIELEQKALLTPVEIFEEKIRKFNSEMDKISQKRKSALFNFNGEINELMAKLWDEVNEFSKSYAQTLFNDVSKYLKSLYKTIPAKDLIPRAREFFATKLSSDIEKWRLNLESDLLNKYSHIAENSAKQINELIKRITEIASNLFDISSPLLFENFEFKTVSKFAYKTKDDPLFLEIDIYKLLPYLLPRKFLLNLILKKMKNEIDEKSGLNSGSIMGFYRTSIEDAALKFKYEMDEKVNQVISYINSAVSTALKNKSLSEQLIHSKLNKINNDLALLNSLKISEN